VSEDRVEIVRQAFESVAEGGVDAMLAHVGEDFVMETPARLAAEPDTYRGHAGVRRWFDSFYEAVDRIEFEAKRLELRGERVAMSYVMTTRGRTTGIEASMEATALCDVEGGKITRLAFYPTWDEMLADSEAGQGPG
jgi:ketosteroid isomerase-like protein